MPPALQGGCGGHAREVKVTQHPVKSSHPSSPHFPAQPSAPPFPPPLPGLNSSHADCPEQTSLLTADPASLPFTPTCVPRAILLIYLFSRQSSPQPSCTPLLSLPHAPSSRKPSLTPLHARGWTNGRSRACLTLPEQTVVCCSLLCDLPRVRAPDKAMSEGPKPPTTGDIRAFTGVRVRASRWLMLGSFP